MGSEQSGKCFLTAAFLVVTPEAVHHTVTHVYLAHVLSALTLEQVIPWTVVIIICKTSADQLYIKMYFFLV